AARLDEPIERAAPPGMLRADLHRSDPRHLQPCLLLVPLAVEDFGPGAQHDRQDAREIFRRNLAALFSPEPRNPLAIPRKDFIGIAAADAGASGKQSRSVE